MQDLFLKKAAILILNFQKISRSPGRALSMKKIIQFSPNANRFFLENCQFSPLLNVHFINIAGNPLLMGLSKTRLFAKNVLYYCLMAKNKLKKVANESLAKSLEKRKAKKTPEFKKVFNFDSLVRKLHQLIESFPDPRTGKNISKSMKDAALGAFSIFFTQSPSFLAYQTSMQETQGQNNADSLFGINEILSDNHIRKLLDEVHPSYIFPLFNYIFDGLNACGYLDEFRSFNNNLLIALDGTQYYSSSSNNIHCDGCSQRHHKKDGSITYSHSAVLAALVKPGSNKAISLTPEYITPQDGHEKQDCETAAAKRWLGAYGPMLKQLGLRVTITGDDLYCHQPLCEIMLDKDLALDFILVCKEESHKTLYEYVEFLNDDIQTVEVKRWEGKRLFTDTYYFLNGVPLRDGKDALEVNWCKIITKNESGKVVYKNAFATNFEVTENNVIEIVTDGRARWKIENENNNVLKTKGYHLEHNFGHGKKNLSALLMTFNLLAFLFHTVLDLMDEKYKLIRKTLPTRKTFFQDIRALTRYIWFDSWNQLMIFMLRGLKLKIPIEPDVNDTS